MAVLNIQGFTQVYTRGSDFWQGSIPFRDFFIEWSKGKMGANFTFEFGNQLYTAASPSIGLYAQNRQSTSGAAWATAYTQMRIPPEIKSGKLYFGARVNRTNVVMSQLTRSTLAKLMFSGSVTINGVSTSYWPTAVSTSTAVFVEVIADYPSNNISVYLDGTLSESITLTEQDMLKFNYVNFGSEYIINPANTSQICYSISGGSTQLPATMYLKDLYMVWDSPDDPNPTGRLGAVTIARWVPSATGAVDGDWTYAGATGIADVAGSIDRKLFNAVTPGKFATSASQTVSYIAPTANLGTGGAENLGGDIYGIVVRSVGNRNSSSLPVSLKTQIDYGSKTETLKQNLTAVNEAQAPLVMDTKPTDPVVDLTVSLTKENPD